jgi:hypothetical protein
MKTAFLSKDSLRNTKEITKNIAANFRAVLQPAHIVMFGCIVFFCFKKMEGAYANLAFGFVAFYVLTLYNSQGFLTRKLNDKKDGTV